MIVRTMIAKRQINVKSGRTPGGVFYLDVYISGTYQCTLTAPEAVDLIAKMEAKL